MLPKPKWPANLRAEHNKDLKFFQVGEVLCNIEHRERSRQEGMMDLQCEYSTHFLSRFALYQGHRLDVENGVELMEQMMQSVFAHCVADKDHRSREPYKRGDLVVLSGRTPESLHVGFAYDHIIILARAKDSEAYTQYKQEQAAYNEQQVITQKTTACIHVDSEKIFRGIQEAIEDVLDEVTFSTRDVQTVAAEYTPLAVSEQITDIFIRAWTAALGHTPSEAAATPNTPDYGNLDEKQRCLVDKFSEALRHIF